MHWREHKEAYSGRNLTFYRYEQHQMFPSFTTFSLKIGPKIHHVEKTKDLMKNLPFLLFGPKHQKSLKKPQSLESEKRILEKTEPEKRTPNSVYILGLNFWLIPKPHMYGINSKHLTQDKITELKFEVLPESLFAVLVLPNELPTKTKKTNINPLQRNIFF